MFFLNSAPPTNDPSGFLSGGNGFLMRQGYSIMAIAWDPTAPTDRKSLTATYPVAKNPDGSSIVGPALEEITYDNASGQKIPFPATTAERVAKRDPRPSVQERYRSHAGYVAKVTLAATNLANDRLLLREDVLRSIAKAVVSPVGQ